MDYSNTPNRFYNNQGFSRPDLLTVFVLTGWLAVSPNPAISQQRSNGGGETAETRSQFYMIPNDDDPRRGFVLSVANRTPEGENFEFCDGERSKLDLSTLVESDSDCDGRPTGTLVYSMEQLENAEIFGSDLAFIGTVDEVLTSADNHPESLLVGIGGFLGIGEEQIAIPFDPYNSDIQLSEEGNLNIVIRTMPGKKFEPPIDN